MINKIFILVLFCSLTCCSQKPTNMVDAFGKIFYVSSELQPSQNLMGPYGAHNLWDNDIKTAWSEGEKGSGINEYIRVVLKKPISQLKIVNGYGKSQGKFTKNNRVKDLELTIYNVKMPKDGYVSEKYVPVHFVSKIDSIKTKLIDQVAAQKVVLPEKWYEILKEEKIFGFEVKILSVYKGTAYDDTCLSTLEFISSSQKSDNTSIRVDDSGIWVTTGENKVLVVKSLKSVYQLIEVDKSGKWGIIIEMPKKTEGRVQTVYRVFYLDAMRLLSEKKIGENITELYGFKYKDSKTSLHGFDSKKQREVFIDLSKLAI